MARPPRLIFVLSALALAFSAVGGSAGADVGRFPGGGTARTDCMLVEDVEGVPADSRAARCTDGDPACDGDGVVNGLCRFQLRLCIDQPGAAVCGPDTVTGAEVLSASPVFTALAEAVARLEMPTEAPGPCTDMVAVDIPRGARRSGKQLLRARALMASGHADKDRLRLVCRPPAPAGGDFAQIERRIFKVSCATASCHGAAGAGGLVLLPGAAYSNLVGMPASNPVAATAGLLRVAPGDPDRSFLLRKLEGALADGEGEQMPRVGTQLPASLIDLVRRWIVAGAGA